MNEIRLDSIQYAIVRMKRIRPFVIANHRSSEVVNVLIRLSSGNREGMGAMAPNHVTGDTLESSLSFLRKLAPRIEGNELEAETLHSIMDSVSSGDTAAKCGVDCALHDLWGRVEGRPVHRMLGSDKVSIATSVTLGIDDVEITLERAREIVGKGFSILKVKAGIDLRRDIEVIRRSREEHPGVEMRIDCNQGFSVEEAIDLCSSIENYQVSMVEQPVRAGDIEGMSRVARETSIPIMADESVSSVRDIERISRAGGVEMINIKLAKSGGLHPALEMAQTCKDEGMTAMVGCMAECQASIAAGLHFALSSPVVTMADLDSHLSLLNDPTRGVRCEDGNLSPLPAPGLGVEIADVVGSVTPRGIEWKAIR